MGPAMHPWWIISSAALALHGVDPGLIGDVDVLFDARDADAVLAPLGLEAAVGSGSDRFRSALFVTWRAPPLAVDLFAGFELREEDRWSLVTLATRCPVDVGDARLWIPSREELRALLLRFGRPKDIARAALLTPSARFPSRSESA